MTADRREQALAAVRRQEQDARDLYSPDGYDPKPNVLAAALADLALVRAALTPAPLPADLAEIQARADHPDLTPGPWEVEHGAIFESPASPFTTQIASMSGTRKWRADAAFIAHARTDVPALVAELAELRARPTLTAEEARNYLNEDQAVSVEDWHAAYAKLRGIAEGTNHDKEPRSGSEGATS